MYIAWWILTLKERAPRIILLSDYYFILFLYLYSSNKGKYWILEYEMYAVIPESERKGKSSMEFFNVSILK